MGLFDGISNPWEPGGQNAPSMPWAKPAMNYGWGHGNDFFHPKTKEQIHKEAMLQLAVLAAIVVAPMVLGAAGAAGAGAAGAGATGAGAAGAGAAGAGVATGAGAIESGVIVATQTGAAAATTAGAAVGGISTAGAMALGGFGALLALKPFLQPNAMQVLHSAASEGEAPLNAALHQLSHEGSNRVEYQREEPYRSPVTGLQQRVPSLRGELPLHDSVPMLVGLAEEIGKDAGLQNELLKRNLSSSSASKLAQAMTETALSRHVWNPGFSDLQTSQVTDPTWTVAQLRKAAQLSPILTLLEKRVYDDPDSPFDGSFSINTKAYLNPIITKMQNTGRTSYFNATIELNEALTFDQAKVIYAYELQNASNYKKDGSAKSAATLNDYLNSVFEIETDAQLTAMEFQIESGLDALRIDRKLVDKIQGLVTEFRADYRIPTNELMADIRVDAARFDIKGNKRIMKIRGLANPRYRSENMVDFYTEQWNRLH